MHPHTHAYQKRGGNTNGVWGSRQRVVKMATVILGICVVGYIAGPPLYWHSMEAIAALRRTSSSSCPSCLCDCSSLPLLSLPEGLNFSFADCMKQEEETGEDEQKNLADLLADELRLREAEALESQRRSDMALLEAKKLTSQYQKEADKCNSGMETCEDAREKAEAALEAQRKLTATWEQRARQKGWTESRLRSLL
ncbi:hypothetical protein Ancab_033441 [Ancistrocladus abbreviatus]